MICPPKSEWASTIVLDLKADYSLPLCIDYRKLNATTKRDSLSLPRMDKFFDSLGNAKMFSFLDANLGYWKTAMDLESVPYTELKFQKGIFWALKNSFWPDERASIPPSRSVYYNHCIQVENVLGLLGRRKIILTELRWTFKPSISSVQSARKRWSNTSNSKNANFSPRISKILGILYSQVLWG